MWDLFETDELKEYWEGREFKSWVVRLGFYPRGCWVTGTKVTKPKSSVTMYVAARDESGAAKVAKNATNIVHQLPIAKLLVDGIRFLSPADMEVI